MDSPSLTLVGHTYELNFNPNDCTNLGSPKKRKSAQNFESQPTPKRSHGGQKMAASIADNQTPAKLTAVDIVQMGKSEQPPVTQQQFLAIANHNHSTAAYRHSNAAMHQRQYRNQSETATMARAGATSATKQFLQDKGACEKHGGLPSQKDNNKN